MSVWGTEITPTLVSLSWLVMWSPVKKGGPYFRIWPVISRINQWYALFPVIWKVIRIIGRILDFLDNTYEVGRITIYGNIILYTASNNSFRLSGTTAQTRWRVGCGILHISQNGRNDWLPSKSCHGSMMSGRKDTAPATLAEAVRGHLRSWKRTIHG